VLLPLVVGAYVAWPARPSSRALVTVLVVVVTAGAVVAPWVVRNRVQVGCFALTTDARALWKANNPRTYGVLAHGLWIDDVPELPGAPPWPELAADRTLEGSPTTVDECDQATFYRDEVVDFWREQPVEKARLAGQALVMLWRPTFTVESDAEQRAGLAGTVRRLVEPATMLLVYALALVGCFSAPRRFLALAGLLEGLNTLMALVFAGTVRYRAPYDFLLALLAAIALERIWSRLGGRRGYASAARDNTAR